MAPDRSVLLMVRHPGFVPVKTRLAAAIGPEAARSLYEAMAEDAVGALRKGGHALTVLYDPPEVGEAAASWLGEGPAYLPQQGDDLGERMAAGFLATFAAGSGEAVLVGSDIPGLGEDLADRAFSALRVHDAVVGPARDGGYYLIGFRRQTFLPEAFRGMTWGSADVLSRTAGILESHGLRVGRLDVRGDVDTADDLERLAYGPPAETGPAVRAWLRHYRQGK